MLSFGWPEMLIVAAAALIIVGPRDLPVLLRNIGRIAGKVRRMGNDFRTEISKVAALDDVKDIKKSITQPLADTKSEIEREFNKITATGIEPSGALKPKNSDATDVYEDIKAASADAESLSAAKASMAASVTSTTAANAAKTEVAAAAEAAKPAKKPAAKRKTPAKRKAPAKPKPRAKKS